MRRHLCGVPQERCSGAVTMVNSDLVTGKDKTMRTHSTRKEARRCTERYLEGQGYVRVGPREWKSPDGPILVLRKATHYGASLRSGKAGEGVRSNRVQPDGKCRSGMVYDI